MTTAKPRDFGRLAPAVVEYAARNDPVGGELVRLAAHHIDELAALLVAAGASQLSVVGGLAEKLALWLAPETKGDALSGALQLARAAAKTAEREVFEPRRERRR